MPTTYAHDLFGKRVYRKLSAKLQHLIRSNGNLYRIGQHGPDILFYYFISKNPVTQYGVQTVSYTHLTLPTKLVV